MPTLRRTLLLAGGVLLLACEDETLRPPPVNPPPAGNPAVVLALSDSAPAAGARITISAVIRPGSGITAASYLARLSYDRAALSFVRDRSPGSGLRALNPKPGLVRAGGAATQGFEGGILFALEFQVTDPRRLASLELRLDELNGRDFRTALPRVAADRVARFPDVVR